MILFFDLTAAGSPIMALHLETLIDAHLQKRKVLKNISLSKNENTLSSNSKRLPELFELLKRLRTH